MCFAKIFIVTRSVFIQIRTTEAQQMYSFLHRYWHRVHDFCISYPCVSGPDGLRAWADNCHPTLIQLFLFSFFFKDFFPGTDTFFDSRQTRNERQQSSSGWDLNRGLLCMWHALITTPLPARLIQPFLKILIGAEKCVIPHSLSARHEESPEKMKHLSTWSENCVFMYDLVTHGKKKKLSGWKMVFRTFQLSQSDGQSNWTPDSWGWVSLVCRVQCSSQQSTYRKGTSLLDKGNKGAGARTAVNRKKLWMLMREIADNPCSDLSVNFIPC